MGKSTVPTTFVCTAHFKDVIPIFSKFSIYKFKISISPLLTAGLNLRPITQNRQPVSACSTSGIFLDGIFKLKKVYIKF
jgi:hypothetical protein